MFVSVFLLPSSLTATVLPVVSVDVAAGSADNPLFVGDALRGCDEGLPDGGSSACWYSGYD